MSPIWTFAGVHAQSLQLEWSAVPVTLLPEHVWQEWHPTRLVGSPLRGELQCRRKGVNVCMNRKSIPEESSCW